MSDNHLYINYFLGLLNTCRARNSDLYSNGLNNLETILRKWAGMYYKEIVRSGSTAKGTAISLSSDIDLMVSLASHCNENSGGLKSIYDSLYNELEKRYQYVKKQNVSIRIKLLSDNLQYGNIHGDLEVDIIPARSKAGCTDYHNLYLSKTDTWKQTNVKIHINDISNSGRANEIKLLKIWRELHDLHFPSIYLEYLTLKVLANKPKAKACLPSNFFHVLEKLSQDIANPLSDKIVDPANSNNILSDLLNDIEKNKIINRAKQSLNYLGKGSIKEIFADKFSQ